MPIRKTGGRNNEDASLLVGSSGGHKQRYRIIDFVRRDKEKFLQKLRPSNTIQIVRDSYQLCFITLMVKDTSCAGHRS
ncbi:MAG: hypothetical protein R2877_08565 [Bdellovibrionota bacterium]